MQNANNAIFFLLNIAQWFITFMFLARLILQLIAVNTSNPISQSILRITQPVLSPLQKIFPNFNHFNTAAFVILLLAQALPILIQTKLLGVPTGLGQVLILSLVSLLRHTLDFYFWCIVLSAILSWLPNPNYHPITQIISSITQPILAPISRRLPLLGGIDFSPVVAIIIIKLIEILVLGIH